MTSTESTPRPAVSSPSRAAPRPASPWPARFVRLVEGGLDPGQDRRRSRAGGVLGASDYMREIMGYAPVEPDGSVLIQVPADVAFEINVLDANGRRLPGFPEHSDWLQVRAGEVLKCNGCHTPPTQAKPLFSRSRRAVRAPPTPGDGMAQPPPDSVATYPPTAGQTMAEARAAGSLSWGSNLSTARCSMMPSIDVFYTDVWTNTTIGLTGESRHCLPARRDANSPEIAPIPTATPGCESSWASNCRVVINYPEHIEQLWTQTRTDSAGNHTCTQSVLPQSDQRGRRRRAAGRQSRSVRTRPPTPIRMSWFPTSICSSRTTCPGHPTPTATRLRCRWVRSSMPAAPTARTRAPRSHCSRPTVATATHAILSPAELRMISEWLDIGAQNFNNPFDPNVPKN